ncbi:hypothetical protein P879_02628, partial [Paragonimus westermani]
VFRLVFELSCGTLFGRINCSDCGLETFSEHVFSMSSGELMTLENSGLLDRVADLERRSAEQASELTGLKASLAECLRRISLLEANKGTALCQLRPGGSSSQKLMPNASTGRNVPQRSELMPNRRPTSKSRQGHGGVSSSRDGPMPKSTPHRSEAKSSSSSALDRRASAGLCHVVSAGLERLKPHFPLVGRSAKAMSLVDGQLSNDVSKDARTELSHHWRPGSLSKYYETSDGPTSYNLMWRSVCEGDLTDGPIHHYFPGGFRTMSRRTPPLPPALPPSSLCLPPNLSRRGRPSSGPASGPCCYDPDAQHPIRSGRSKEPNYIPNDGVLRVYLHGRPINAYLPSVVLETFDLNAPQPPPEETLKLEWAYPFSLTKTSYGYRGRDCRNNLHYLPTGEIIYFVAAVVVLYNIEEQCQRHYLEHTDDVKCIAIHPDRITVATGQVAGHSKQQGKPHVRIWSSVDLRTLRVLGLGDFERGLCCLSFSKTDSGARLCAVDDAQEHVISVWEWQKGKKITDTKCSNDPVVAAEFHPLDESSIITCGKNHLNFWSLDGNTLSKKSAIFETGKISCDKPKFVLCLDFAENGDVLTGDSSGNIVVWRRGTNTISQICHNVHDGGIFSLCMMANGHLVSGGSKDRRLVFFDAALYPTNEVRELPELHGSVRTIIPGPGDMLLIGTTRNTILQTGPGMEFSSLMFGHSDEFWAVASHPQSHHFLTAGHDRLVIFWDSLSKQAVWAKEINDPIHCAAFYHPDLRLSDNTATKNLPNGDVGLGKLAASADTLVALGSTSGRWLVMDCARHEIIAAHSDGIGEQIQCLAYSPDGRYIALGSRDNSIYVYQVLENGRKYSRVGRCSGHSSFVLHLDWSSDSQYLRSESGDYELLFWTAHDCRQVVSPSSLRDLDWATYTCTLSWSAIGIWPDGADGTDINACTVYTNSALLATADDHGKVKLFRYPANKPKAEFHAYTGHSSHVTNVAFLYDGSRLISTGGKDTAVLQWEVCV